MIRLREVNNRDVGVNLDIHISFSSVRYSRHSTFFSKISYLTTLVTTYFINPYAAGGKFSQYKIMKKT